MPGHGRARGSPADAAVEKATGAAARGPDGSPSIPESPAAIAALGALASLDLPDRVEHPGIGLGGGRAAEEQQGDDGEGAVHTLGLPSLAAFQTSMLGQVPNS